MIKQKKAQQQVWPLLLCRKIRQYPTAIPPYPNIGPVKAQAIIQYREEQGPFYTIEQIQEVNGIGEKTFEKIKDMITV